MDNVDSDKTKDVPWLCSCRVGLALIACIGFTNLYAHRVNMSVAMVCMINQTALKMELTHNTTKYGTNGTSEDYTCGGLVVNHEFNETFSESTAGKEGEFTWSKSVQGLVLGAFFWGYMFTQIPGGWLANRYGGKRVFGWFMLVCALSTLVMPVAAKIHPGFLIALRIIDGCCQGVVWPAMHGIWAYWSPPVERSKLIGFTFAGAHMGTVLTFPLAGLLCEYGFNGGWPSIFYIIGIIGIAWFILWMLLAYDTPQQHPRISVTEREFIQKSLAGQTSKFVDKNVTIPWMNFLKSRPFWAIMITHIAVAWMIYSFITNVPTYMREVLKFDIKKNGFMSSVPFIGLWAMTVISGLLADWLRKKDTLSTTNVRKLNTVAGTMIPAIICIVLGYLDCSQWILAMILLSIAISLIGCNYGAGFVVNHADIAPQYSSILFGISNTFACIPGFIAPYVIGVITSGQTQAEWRIVFFLTAGIAAFGAIVYLFFASGDQQKWAEISKIDDSDKADSISLKTEITDQTLIDNCEQKHLAAL